ncbi:5-oxoprolinase subunit PxpB [Cupriavidus pauculus]|uniref:Allophanate hydrolase n=1 Tax=Cupriavidus pauculus TaxID=82633 RepID=A0A2N5C3N0_9BURK|nr:5-oxoprolinase subunit PxpB [Cupriavidus pauculus]PLP96815.1 allophanate hydrolase [Cupriavidus pauculus]
MSALPISVAHTTAAKWRIEPSGERLLIVSFETGTEADALSRANRSACAAAHRLRVANLPAVTDIVPALTTVGVHYRPAAVTCDAGESPFHAMLEQLSALLATPLDAVTEATRLIEIPVCYGGNFGPDLEEVGNLSGLATNDVIALHSSVPVNVLMLGFAPGHPYVGLFDDRLKVPRRSTPRTTVPAGSIGLANRQSVIYPMDLPGGWNIIGRTPLALFDPARETPCLLNAGDNVRFVPIGVEEFFFLAAGEGKL